MKKLLLTMCFALACSCLFAQVKISKDNCSITVNGKTFSLSSKVKIVESFPDLKIQVVESFPDIEIKLVEGSPSKCCEWKVVESFPDIKIQFVNSFPDIKVKFVTSFPKVVNEKN